MADADRIKRYKRATPPSIPDNGRFVAEELKRIEQSNGTLADVIALLEARLVAGGL